MTLLPGSLASAPLPTRGGGASSPSTPAARSEGSRDFASALRGALDGSSPRAERGTPDSRGGTGSHGSDSRGGPAATDADAAVSGAGVSGAAPQADAQPATAVTSSLMPGLAVPAGLAIPADVDTGMTTDVATPVTENAGTDNSSAAGTAVPETALWAPAPAASPSADDARGLAADIGAGAVGPDVGVDIDPDAAAGARDGVDAAAVGAAVSPDASARLLAAGQQAMNRLDAPSASIDAVTALGGVPAAAGVAAAAVTAAPGAPVPTAPLTAAAPVSGIAAALLGAAVDAGEQGSDLARNGPDQSATPGAPGAATVPSGIAAPAVAFATAVAQVAAVQASPHAQAPLSTQIARPLFSLANAAHGEHVMTISITPDNLGPVTVRAHVGGEGIRVELFAPNDAGRDALRSILPELKRDLAGSGMTGTSLDLSSRNQAESSREHGRQPGGSGRERASVSGLEGTGAPAPERTTVPTWYGTTASIDVMA